MIARPIPKRHRRSYGDDPQPTPADAVDEPSAFPSWFMRVTCHRCRQEQMVNEEHFAHRDLLIRDIIAKDAPRRPRRQGREGGAAHRQQVSRGN